MKKLLLVLLIVFMGWNLSGCSRFTRCKDCGDEVYKDGYCKYHYSVHTIQEGLDQAAKSVFDAVDSVVND